MYVLHVVHNFLPEFEGGTEHVVRKLSRAQIELGARVKVLAGSDRQHRGQDVEREDLEGLEVFRVRRTSEEAYAIAFERPRLSAVLAELFDRERPDIVHVHHWSTLTFDVARLARVSGARVFVTLHDFFSVCPRFFRISPLPEVSCPAETERAPCVACARPDIDLPERELLAEFARRDTWVAAELAVAERVYAPSMTHVDALRQALPKSGPEPEPALLGLLQDPPGVSRRRTAPTNGVLRLVTWGNHVWLKGLMVLIDALELLSVPETVELHVHGGFREEDLGAGRTRTDRTRVPTRTPPRPLAAGARVARPCRTDAFV